MYELHTKTREQLEAELQNSAYLAHQITTVVTKKARKERIALLKDSMDSAKRLFATLKQIEKELE